MFSDALMYLVLARNAIIHTSWKFPKGLVMLNLADNLIKEIEFLYPLDQLRLLNLSYNRISNIGDISMIKELRELYISHNLLSGLDSVCELSRLTVLNASHNEINRESFDILPGFRKLTAIKLKKNPCYSDSWHISIVKSIVPMSCAVDPANLLDFSNFKQIHLSFIPLRLPQPEKLLTEPVKAVRISLKSPPASPSAMSYASIREPAPRSQSIKKSQRQRKTPLRRPSFVAVALNKRK